LVTGYDPSIDQFDFFDPAVGREQTEMEFENRVLYTFEESWLGHQNLLIPPGSMVMLHRDNTNQGNPVSSGGGKTGVAR